MSSWWAASRVCRHPVLDEAVRSQLEATAHVMFGGITHPPAVELAELLVDIAPAGLEHVFFADSGSVAVEVAIKMALQHARGPGRPDRPPNGGASRRERGGQSGSFSGVACYLKKNSSHNPKT